MAVIHNTHFNTAVFYTCGTCNLQCRYCGIHKSPVLKDIDDILAQSFEGDYYFNRVKEYFPRRDMLTSFETWGGEPFIHMERLHPILRQLIEYYPYLQNGYSSTNFSYPTWTDKFFGLMDVFGEYPERDFYYCLQLSVDGPSNINDAGRGAGTTERCINNFKKLVELLKEDRLADNVKLTITLKGTLDNDTMKTLLTKEAIINYYKFYEDNFIRPIHELNKKNVTILNGIPNTAVPSPVTVEDGKLFAQLVKMCREIEQTENNGLEFYKVITPFDNNITQQALTYKYGYHTCGTGDANIGFLPYNMVSTCHEGFTQIVEEYTKVAAGDNRDIKSTITFDKFLDQQAVAMSANDEQYKNHYYKMQLFNNDNSTARLATSACTIMALALAGQVEPCFLDENNALKAAIFIQGHTSYCIKDNYNITGSYTMTPVGLYKLLLNGAMQYIQHDGELRVNEGSECSGC